MTYPMVKNGIDMPGNDGRFGNGVIVYYVMLMVHSMFTGNRGDIEGDVYMTICNVCHPEIRAKYCDQCIEPPADGIWDHPRFNPPQSEAWKIIDSNPEANLIAATGTGTGKTTIAEMVMFKRLKQNPNTKFLVLMPLKALANEKGKEWSGKLGCRVMVLTSDSDIELENRNNEMKNSDIVIASYEILGSIVRHPERYDVINEIDCLIVDEVHELADKSRGGLLDGALTRFFLTKRENHQKIQFIGLSATFDNIDHLAAYITQNVGTVNVINSPFSPIKTTVLRGGKPRYYPSRGRVEAVMDDLEESGWMEQPGQTLIMVLSIPDVLNIQEMINEQYGMNTAAAHYSELSREERADVEESYRDGQYKVLVSTPTLLAGVNLSCRNIILDISYFDDFKMNVLPIQKIGQAQGRAGRLPYWTEGFISYICEGSLEEVATEELAKDNIVRGTLLDSAEAVLNAEINLGQNNKEALLAWYQNTYSKLSSNKTDEQVKERFEQALTFIQRGFVKENDGRLEGTLLGKLTMRSHLDPRFVVDAIITVKESAENVDEIRDTNIANLIIDLFSSRNSDITMPERKKEALKHMILSMGDLIDGGGNIDWRSKQRSYSWMRDIQDNLGRLDMVIPIALGSNRMAKRLFKLARVSAEKGFVPVGLAKLSEELTARGIRGIGFKRLLFLYTNAVTDKTITARSISNRTWGLAGRMDTYGSFSDGDPSEKFRSFDTDPSNVQYTMPLKMIDDLRKKLIR